jgi:hypothetical protein
VKISLRYKPTRTEFTIEAQHNDPDKLIELNFKAKNLEEQPIVDALKDNSLKYELENQYGHYGHRIVLASTTNLDLASAVRYLSSFELINIEPRIAPIPLPKDVQS